MRDVLVLGALLALISFTHTYVSPHGEAETDGAHAVSQFNQNAVR